MWGYIWRRYLRTHLNKYIVYGYSCSRNRLKDLNHYADYSEDDYGFDDNEILTGPTLRSLRNWRNVLQLLTVPNFLYTQVQKGSQKLFYLGLYLN
jgi:hypothetical protein